MAGRGVTCSGLGVASGRISSVEYLEGQSEKANAEAKESGRQAPTGLSYTPSTPKSLMGRPGRNST